MNLVTAIVVAALFGVGVTLMLKRDLIRIVGGVVMISNAANLFLMSAGLLWSEAPIKPLGDDRPADPLVQALTLTAVVITFGTTALLLSLAYRVYEMHRTLDQEELEWDAAAPDTEPRDVPEPIGEEVA